MTAPVAGGTEAQLAGGVLGQGCDGLNFSFLGGDGVTFSFSFAQFRTSRLHRGTQDVDREVYRSCGKTGRFGEGG